MVRILSVAVLGLSMGMGLSAFAASSEGLSLKRYDRSGAMSGFPDRDRLFLVAQAEQSPNTGQASREFTAADRSFIADAAQRHMEEIELARLALQTTDNNVVGTHALRMIEDHTAAFAKLDEIAQAEQIAPPENTTAQHQERIVSWEQLPPDELDEAYVARVRSVDYARRAEDLRRQASTSSNAALRTYAEALLPVMRAHQTLAGSLNTAWQATGMERPQSGDDAAPREPADASSPDER